ncbi:hypothetical protein BP6252_02635 [Coleophoma cylindrospora]|uniref:COX assembly mitochondrial protein n=1 Tax=Coleophoma cylindrospora TaxID=1849047 RepID=A0A3D8SFC6_9HELO|nr:hypothetical protein BP6252_02635 [Coleophoma cylindrospora]
MRLALGERDRSRKAIGAKQIPTTSSSQNFNSKTSWASLEPQVVKMHPHLHTKDNTACEEVMNILDECHARGFMWKAVGMCNDAKTQVNLCLRAQRLQRTAANREAAKGKRQELKQKWAEIDANS